MKPIDREQHRDGIVYSFRHDVVVEGLYPVGTCAEADINDWYIFLPHEYPAPKTLGPYETYNECLHVLEDLCPWATSA